MALNILLRVARCFCDAVNHHFRWSQHPSHWQGATEVILLQDDGIATSDWQQRRRKSEAEQLRRLHEALQRRRVQKAKEEEAKREAQRLQKEEHSRNIAEYERRKYLEGCTGCVLGKHRCPHGYPHAACLHCIDKCSICKGPIRGVPCVVDGARVHFGCWQTQIEKGNVALYGDSVWDADDAAGFVVSELPSLQLPPLVGKAVDKAAVFQTGMTDAESPLEAVAGNNDSCHNEQLVSATSLIGWVSCCQNSSYDFFLSIVRAYSLSNADLEAKFNSTKARMGTTTTRRLFHGTTIECAAEIHKKGFRLPWHAGMFGKGIYFADTPQKSWQYCRGSNHIFVCDVVLGESKLLYTGDSSITRDSGFDSVKGVSRSEGGDLRCAEYIVYSELQVLPLFLLELSATHMH